MITFEASTETFLNSFNNFSKSRELLRARVPAALLFFQPVILHLLQMHQILL